MGNYQFSKKEINSFEKKEEKYRSLKNDLVLLEKPKDLANLLYQMVVGRRDTYYDTKNGLRTQPSGKQRSVEDMYRVLISYHWDISYQSFYEIMEDLRNGKYNSKNQFVGSVFTSHYCYTVCKTVHNPSGLYIDEKSIREALGKKNIEF